MALAGRLSNSNLFNVFSRKSSFVKCSRVALIQWSRGYALKHINPKRFTLEEVAFHQDEPCAVKILEKHGKAWHVLNEGNNQSLAHTISGDFDCYEGLSRDFALKFPQTEDLKNEDNPLGSVRVMENGAHFIYYLIIRENWWDRGAYRPMRESLISMRDHALKNGVKSIAMGRLGAQKDGLDFGEILKDIKKIFYDTDITLTIYSRRT